MNSMSYVHTLQLLSRSYVKKNINLSKLVFRNIHGGPNKNVVQKLTEVKDASVKTLRLDKLKNFQDYSIKIHDQKENFIKYTVEKGEQWYEKYIKLIGLDKIKVLQERVLTLEDDLVMIQQQRREMDKLLKSKRDERQRMEEELRKLDRIRDHEKYITLVKQESAIIIAEKDLAQQFEEADEMEREVFSRFCDAIRDSHKEERLHTEHTKYFGYMMSIAGVILGSILTTIVNVVRNRDLLSGIEKGVDQKILKINDNLGGITSYLKSVDQQLNSVLEQARRREENARYPGEPKGKASWSYWDYFRWVPGLGKKGPSEDAQSNSESKPATGYSVVRIATAAVGVSIWAVKAVFGY